MKICTKCKENKLLSDFSPDRRHLDGLQSQCKPCKKIYTDAWIIKNRDLKRELDRLYCSRNAEGNRIKAAKWTCENSDRNRERSANWKKLNPGKVNAQVAKRKADELRAMPKWLSVDQKREIESIYNIAHETTDQKKEKYVVDHIVPLKGKQVCGLHVPWNLRVISNIDNCRKGNKHE